jgi:hypothetical protein
MNNLQNISALISVRNFLAGSIDNMQIKLSRDEIKSIQNRVSVLDKTIVDASLKLDLTNFGKEVVSHSIKQLSFVGEEPEVVMNRIKEDEKKTTEDKQVP